MNRFLKKCFYMLFASMSDKVVLIINLSKAKLCVTLEFQKAFRTHVISNKQPYNFMLAI